MTVDEWKALQSRLVDAWEQFTHTLQQAADALADGTLCEEKRDRDEPK